MDKGNAEAFDKTPCDGVALKIGGSTPGHDCRRPRYLATHAWGDRVVDISSAQAFVEKYRASGNMCETFFYTPAEEHDKLTGHCIWIPGSWPHKLILCLEREMKRFVTRQGGLEDVLGDF